MKLYIFGYKDLKNVVIFLFQTYPCFLEKKNNILIFSSKTYFLIEKFSENLSKYSNYECLQVKITKYAINASGNSAKKPLNLLGVLRGNTYGS